MITLLNTGCAAVPKDPTERAYYLEVNDPGIEVNRAIFQFNVTIIDSIIAPISAVYEEVFPDPVREGITNFLANLRRPITVFNSLLQGDIENAANAFGSFLLNSTAGIGGVIDIAGDNGVKVRREDFGQTLAVWGIGEGFFVMLPALGPSSVRDSIGLGVDIITDPISTLITPLGQSLRISTDLVTRHAARRDQIEILRAASVDYYVSVRSLYRQKRRDSIANGSVDPFQAE